MSPSGEWSDKGANKNDGEDLTEANFIDTKPGEGNPFGTNWDFKDWKFEDVSILPKLMTTADADGNRSVINGQSDLSHKDYLDMPVEISTAVSYDPAGHAGKQINILSGGQLFAQKAYEITELAAPANNPAETKTVRWKLQTSATPVPSATVPPP